MFGCWSGEAQDSMCCSGCSCCNSSTAAAAPLLSPVQSIRSDDMHRELSESRDAKTPVSKASHHTYGSDSSSASGAAQALAGPSVKAAGPSSRVPRANEAPANAVGIGSVSTAADKSQTYGTEMDRKRFGDSKAASVKQIILNLNLCGYAAIFNGATFEANVDELATKVRNGELIEIDCAGYDQMFAKVKFHQSDFDKDSLTLYSAMPQIVLAPVSCDIEFDTLSSVPLKRAIPS